MRRAWAVAIKEMRQIRRDRRTLLVLLFIPALFLFLYGYALNFDIKHVALGVQDRDDSAASRALIANFVHSTYFDLAARMPTDAAVAEALDAGHVRAVLTIPDRFGRDLDAGTDPVVQILVNGDNANTATTVLGYAMAVLREPVGGRAVSAKAAFAGVQPRVWYNPELRSTLFLVPGLVAYIAMITAVIATALSIVREKESGTMEQVRMAPISTPAFLLGKTLPYLVLSQISATLVILAAMALFGLPMRGTWIALELVVGVFLLGALATGLLVSTVARTQQMAFQLSALIAFLPTFILSGFIFPIASMPPAVQYLTLLVPARYFLIALRGIVLKAAPLETLGAQLLALTIYAVVALALASMRLARARE